jgi:hypothetical protein
MSRWVRLARALALLVFATLSLHPCATRADERVLETRHLRLIYTHPAQDFIAEYTARCFENSLRFHSRIFDYPAREKVTLILDDQSDYANAGVWCAPRNFLSMHLAPSNFVYETGPANERINFTLNHEVAHIVTLDEAQQPEKFFRGMFLGKVPEDADHPETMIYNVLTLPRRNAPRWHREGTAVFFETWMSGGFGRAQGPWDEMVFRAMVRDSTPFYDPLGLESQASKADFQVGVNSYLYGTRFTTWLAWRTSPAQFVDWVARRPGSRGYYAQQFRHVFGKSLGAAWHEWVDWEHEFQRANLDSIRRDPVTPTRDLSPRALGSVSPAFLDSVGHCLYAAVYYPGALAHIAAIPLDGGPLRRLHEVKGPALYFVSSLAWDPGSRMLFYTTDNDAWRDLCALDPRTGHSRVLMRDARVGDLAFDRADRSLWAVRHFNGISTLVRMTPPYRDYRRVVSLPYGRDLYDLDISPDGSRMIASMAEISGRQTLRLYDLKALADGDTTSRVLHDFGSSVPSSFVFSRDGRFLYGSSYYTGVSNIFRYDFAADSMDVVTNAETGFFRPVPLGGDSLAVFRYSGQGFVPATLHARPLSDVRAITFFGAQVVEKHPELETWKVPPPSTVNLDSLGLREEPYRGLRSIRLMTLVPVAEGYKSRAAAGLDAELSDPLSTHRVSLTATVSPAGSLPEDERLHLSARYARPRWDAHVRYNPASFYDFFGPTKTARRGTNLGLTYTRTLLHDEPHTLELRIGADGWTGLERLPDAQNVAVSPEFDRLLTHFVQLRDENVRSSIGAVDQEKGYRWSTAYGNNGVRFDRASGPVWRGFPQFEGSFDVGAPLPVRHVSLWLRSAAGWSPGDRREPFANFFFGGFGNDWVDHREVKRYREPASFPGIDLDAASGTSYGKVMLDLNLPPLLFDRLGTPAFYGTWLRLSVFGGGLGTNLDAPAERRRLANVGAQADLRLQAFSRQNMTLSTGYARAFEHGATMDDEWMVSLRIL